MNIFQEKVFFKYIYIVTLANGTKKQPDITIPAAINVKNKGIIFSLNIL